MLEGSIVAVMLVTTTPLASLALTKTGALHSVKPPPTKRTSSCVGSPAVPRVGEGSAYSTTAVLTVTFASVTEENHT